MAVFNSAVFYSGVYFTDSSTGKTGTGGIDPERRNRKQIHLPFKPTGLIDRKEGRKDVEDRVDESRQIQAEIAERLAREFSQEVQEAPEPEAPVLETLGALAIEQMTQAEIDVEIGLRLRKKLREEEDEFVVILTMLAHIV